MRLTRRELLAGAAASAAAAPRPQGLLIDTHIHLFASDRSRFPYHRNAVYQPPPRDLDPYARFVREVGIDHAVIVHPEPYQDDHRYLAHCFANEPRPGFFKGTCLYDPIALETPGRMAALVKEHPGRIVALRVHVNREAGAPPTTSGAIRDRDLGHPAVKKVWRAAQDLGLAIQMHMIPLHAPEVEALASELPGTRVIIDHLARSGQGTPEQYSRVLALARHKNVYMKFSGVRYSSKQEHPYADARPLVRRTYDAFGPDRMIWGGLGMDPKEFEQSVEVFEQMFAFAPESDKAKIRGLTAARLFSFPLKQG
jgi:predicted TIM-barrel fold metal-dependent hydrolase